MWKYYKIFSTGVGLTGLVRQHYISVERYEGNEIWNTNWDGAGQAYMDITGMGGGWYLYQPVSVEKVEEIKRQLDDRYKRFGVFAYKNSDSDGID